MKKRITFLMAAFTLLAFLAIPRGVWGQSDYSSDYTGNITLSADGGTNASACRIIISNTEYDGIKAGTSSKVGAVRITVPSGTKYLHIHAAAWNNTTCSLTVTPEGYSDAIALTANSGIANNSPFTFNGNANTSDYYKVITFSSALTSDTNLTFTATGGKRFVIWGVTSEEEGSSDVVATPTFSPAAGTYTQAQNVSINCSTDGATIYYTTNGNDPTTNSSVYSGAINVSTNTTIKAMATAEGYDNSAIATAEYAFITLEHAGTLEDPYTVADARAAIDANAGTQGVYATGIVSAIPTAWNSQYSNITFDFVDNAGDTDVLEAYRCASGTGVDASQVAVGDVVVVYGNLTKYGSTYEFSQDCQLVSLTHPAVAVEAPTFSPVAGTYAEVQTVAISSETEGADIYYTLDGTDPTMESAMYENPITVSETTTIKAIAVNGDNVASNVASANYYFCSADDPYTVTEALAFQAYQYPANGIYVHGIVSTAPTQAPTNNGELTYYISVDGEAANQLEVYKGRGLEQAAFTAQDDLQVGDIVTVYGNVQVYNSTIEFASGNYLVSFERPDAPVVPSITVADATVSVPADGAEGTLTVTYENFTEIIADVYFCNAEGETATYEWITAEINDDNNVEYLVEANEGEARTAYFKVYALDDNTEYVYSNLVTINQAEYVTPALDYAELPFEFDGTYNDIATTDGLTEEGLGNYSSAPHLKFDGSGDWLLLHFIEAPGTLTFDLKANPGSNGWSGTFTVQTSEDGETYTDLATYTDISTNGQSEEFTNLGENVRYIKWIYTEKVNGNVALGNIVLDEYTGPVASITVADATVSVPAEGAEGTLTVTYENITEIIADVYFCDADGQEFTYEWMTAEIDDDNNVEYLVEPNEGEARTAYFKVYAMDDEGELVYSNIVTVSQDAPVVPPTPGNWVLTDLTDLTENDVFVIVGDNGDTYAMPVDGGGQSGAPAAVAVTVVEGTLSGEPAANLQWNIRITEDGYTFYPNGETETWLYCTNTNNGVRVGTGDAKHFTLDEGYLTTTETTDQRYIGIYNSQDWRCYKLGTDGTFPANIADQTFAFYKKVAAATETYPLDITGYEAGSDGGYYLIASPVTVNPANVEGMTAGEYDLYSFDQAEAEEWRNYKVNAFNLEPGKGYLYAKQATEPDEVFHFELTGTPYNGEPITLSKSENVDFPGWNLVGNPFGQTAYIDRDFYVMKSDGSEIIESETNEIAAMQGFFVIADHDGEELEISTEPTEEGGKIVMNVNSNRGNIIDRAMIRFGEGRQLPKFMLNEDNTKLYIAKGEEEYAVARNEAKGEMNLNFEASENGTYTLEFTVANVELDQLLLIDDKTGVSIDMLSTQSYTFNATTDDAAARFRIVFGATTSVQEENINKFAFYNNGNLIINNNGNAILNIVDVLGRIISSYNINGSENVSINAKAGVYMLQLIQGDKIQTQKIVVE